MFQSALGEFYCMLLRVEDPVELDILTSPYASPAGSRCTFVPSPAKDPSAEKASKQVIQAIAQALKVIQHQSLIALACVVIKC
jgi:hypothetical protein